MYIPVPANANTIHLLARFPVAALVLTLVAGVMLIPGPGDANTTQVSYLTFSFDNGDQSVYDTAYPILGKYGYSGVAFVPAGKIGEPGYMTGAQLRELSAAGWEVGSNGMTLTDPAGMTDPQEELSGSKQVLEDMGLQVTSFGNSFGSTRQNILSALAGSYTIYRTSHEGTWVFNTIPPEDPLDLAGVVITSDTPVDEVKAHIAKAETEGKWLILVFHTLDGTGKYSYSSSDFEEIVKYARDIRVRGTRT